VLHKTVFVRVHTIKVDHNLAFKLCSMAAAIGVFLGLRMLCKMPQLTSISEDVEFFPDGGMVFSTA
jgi:hypothetical protein